MAFAERGSSAALGRVTNKNSSKAEAEADAGGAIARQGPVIRAISRAKLVLPLPSGNRYFARLEGRPLIAYSEMVHLRFWGATGLSLLVAISGCGGSGHSADSPAADSISPSDARAFIAQVQRERGIPVDQTPVSSMDQLLQALSDDQVGRFASAVQLVAGKPGIDALAIHATIELA